MHRAKAFTLGVFLFLMIGGLLLPSSAVPAQSQSLEFKYTPALSQGDDPELLKGSGGADNGGSAGDDDAPGETVQGPGGGIPLSDADSFDWSVIRIAWTLWIHF